MGKIAIAFQRGAIVELRPEMKSTERAPLWPDSGADGSAVMMCGKAVPFRQFNAGFRAMPAPSTRRGVAPKERCVRGKAQPCRTSMRLSRQNFAASCKEVVA